MAQSAKERPAIQWCAAAPIGVKTDAARSAHWVRTPGATAAVATFSTVTVSGAGRSTPPSIGKATVKLGSGTAAKEGRISAAV